MQAPRSEPRCRIAWEGLVPLYRNLDGPQLETDWRVVVGLQVVPIG